MTLCSVSSCCSLCLLFCLLSFFVVQCYVHHRDLHSFPTRRSSDLVKIVMSRKDVFEGTGPTPGSYVKVKIGARKDRSEEHTSELQSLTNLVCRLLLEKKKKKQNTTQRENRKKKRQATRATKHVHHE